MPYFLMSDTIGRDPRWLVLARGKAGVADALLAAYTRMHAETSSHLHDGYLTRAQALKECHGRARTLELLATSVLGAPPFLHRPGEACAAKNCLDTSGPWVDGFDYRICGFSKRNPTKGERDRNEAQKADSRDARLREAVYTRDGGCCRYCRSGPLKRKGMGRAKDRRRALQFDHVDPDRAAGPDGGNYVTACGRCNELKGHRTPDEASMVLLPEPTDAQRAAWDARGEQLFDPADNPRDNDNDNPHDNQRDNAHDNQHGVVEVIVPTSAPGADSAGEVRLQVGQQPQRQPPAAMSEGSGSGRVGQPVASPASARPAQPARTPDAPDIYTRRSRAPEHETRPPPAGVP